MKAFMTAILVMSVIAIGSNILLTGYFDYSAGAQYAGDAVRLD